MKKNMIVLVIFLITLIQTIKAIGNDSNIVILNAIENYNFNFNKKEKSVQVNQSLTTTYKCNFFRTEINVSEFYNDKTIINNVKTYIDNKKRNITAQYDYYAIDDIFYSDAHICYFKLPLEKKGSTSEVAFEKTVNDPRYFTSIYFGGEYEILNKTISISIPRWMKVELKEYNFNGFDITKSSAYDSKKDVDIITFTIKNIAASIHEANAPGPSYSEPHLLILSKYAETSIGKVTYYNTLDDLYSWYRSITKDLDNNVVVLKTKAEEITSGANSDIEKIKNIFYWVQDNIRYIAFEDGIAGFKPDKADEVLRKKYGDCKGMAHLTKELLKALGYDARLCWLGTNHIVYDYTTPTIAVDNHMICALIFQGKTYFLDATENYIGFNEYAERIQGRQVLIEDGDKYIYTKVPTKSYIQNADIEKCNMNIIGTNIEGSITREWRGEEKENIFANLNALKREKSIDAFINFLSNGNKDYFLTDFKTSALDNFDKPLMVQYRIKHVNGVSSFGNNLYVDIDLKKDLSDFSIEIKERKHDFVFDYKINKSIEIQLNLPSGYEISVLPKNVLIENEDYIITATVIKLPTKLTYSKKIIIKNTKLKKEKFEQWNKDIEKLKAFYNEQIVLIKK
jgi:Transglutaminase-like superfamily